MTNELMINELYKRAEEVKEYFEKNGLDYGKIDKLGKCGNKEILFLQHISKVDISKPLILDDKPAKVVLIIRKKGDKLEFEQTEYTKKYL